MSLSYTDVDGGGASGPERRRRHQPPRRRRRGGQPQHRRVRRGGPRDPHRLGDRGRPAPGLRGVHARRHGPPHLRLGRRRQPRYRHRGGGAPGPQRRGPLQPAGSASTVDGAQPGIWVTGGDITRDTTLADLGAPYLLYGSLTVGSTSGAPATLTLDPGVSLLFSAGERLAINVHGRGPGGPPGGGHGHQAHHHGELDRHHRRRRRLGRRHLQRRQHLAISRRAGWRTWPSPSPGATTASRATPASRTAATRTAALGFFDTLPAPGSISQRLHQRLGDQRDRRGLDRPGHGPEDRQRLPQRPRVRGGGPRGPLQGCGGNLGCL